MPLWTPPSQTLTPWVPANAGVKGATYDPAVSGTAGTLLTAGTLHLAKIYVDRTVTFDTVRYYVTGAGVSLTNVGVGIWNGIAGGALLSSRVNTSGATTAAFAVAGNQTITLPAALTLTSDFYVGIWATGTTMPTMLRGSTIGGINAVLAVNNSRFVTANTGLTNTAPATLGTLAQNAVAWWAAVS